MNPNRKMNFRSRIFLGVMISLFLLTLIPLTSCTADPYFEYTYCEILATPEDIDAWVEGQDGELDYRPLVWTSTNFETPRRTTIIGYALAEDSNIWNHAECMVLDLR